MYSTSQQALTQYCIIWRMVYAGMYLSIYRFQDNGDCDGAGCGGGSGIVISIGTGMR